MTNWPGNDGPQGGYGGPNPVGGQQPPPPSGWSQPGFQGGWSVPGQPAPGAPPMFAGPGPQPPKNRKPLIITLIAGGAVVLIAAIVGVIVLAGGGKEGGKGGSAGDAVQGYLEALARGDAEAALSYGSGEPGSKEFLTDEILKKQIDKMPITNIKILSDSSKDAISIGQVHVSVSFGDKVSDETLMLKRSGKEWKLDNASVKLDRLGGSFDKTSKVLTLFGKPLPDAAVYVFPGWQDLSTDNPNLKVTSQPVLLKGLSGYASLSSSDVEVTINENGQGAALKAIRDAVAKCVQSTELRPSNCPNGVDEPGAVSANWGAVDLPDLELSSFSSYNLEMNFTGGSVKFPVTVNKSSGPPATGTVRSYISGSVNMAQNPPAVTFR